MILAIDQGTTGTTCIVFDEQVEPIGRAYREFAQHFPQPGCGRARPRRDLWRSPRRSPARRSRTPATSRPGELVAVAIANQRETVCVWDPSTGEPLHRALVWQDRRTAAAGEQLRADGHEPLVRARTGLVLDPYFSATKIAWLLEHVPGLRERARDGRAVFGTIDSWLAFKLTGEHLTDASNASRTLLYDIARRSLGPRAARPVRHSRARAARGPSPAPASSRSTLPEALHGHARPARGRRRRPAGRAVRPGLRRSGPRQEHLRHRLVRAAEHRLHPARARARAARRPSPGGSARRTTYALEASIFVTGAAVQWLRDGLQRDRAAADTEALAASLRRKRRRLLRPRPHRPRLAALGPARARHDRRPHARQHPRAPRARDARGDRLPDRRRRPRDGGRLRRRPSSELRADGGATANAWLMQFQADVLGVPVVLARDRRDDRARRRLPRGRRRRSCARSPTSRAALARALRATSRACADGRALPRLLAGWHGRAGRANLGARGRARVTLPRGPGDVESDSMSDLAPMREQVYTDPRPKEYFDRFHERARTREPDWVYELVRLLTSLYAYTLLRARSISTEKVPGARRGDPRAQPLLVHGPLPDGLLHPPQGALHGQVAAVQAADAVHLHPRRRVPRAPRRARRGDVHHRRDDPRRAAARSRCTARAGARAPASWPTEAKRGIGRLALETGAPVVPIAIHGSSRIRNWKRLQFPEGHRPVRRRRSAGSAIENPTREQQQAVADEILAEIRALYAGPRGARAQGRPAARARAAPRRRARAPRRMSAHGRPDAPTLARAPTSACASGTYG